MNSKIKRDFTNFYKIFFSNVEFTKKIFFSKGIMTEYSNTFCPIYICKQPVKATKQKFERLEPNLLKERSQK